MTRREIGYWIATGLFCLAFVAGGTGHLLRADPMREGMLELGYPVYVMTILGLAKLLGVVALLVPGRPLLYGTTPRFLEVFDLKDLSALPSLEEIKALIEELE